MKTRNTARLMQPGYAAKLRSNLGQAEFALQTKNQQN
jgi:hypothetical protein